MTTRGRAADVVNDFEAWAEVSARMLKRTPSERTEILKTLGLSEIWAKADETWSDALRDDILNERDERPDRYAAICGAEMRRRRAAGEAGRGPRASTADMPAGQDAPAPSVTGTVALTPGMHMPRADGTPYPMAQARAEAAVPETPGQHGGRQATPFVEQIAPSAADVVPPTAEQTSTAGLGAFGVKQYLEAMRAAVGWPMASYARFCAELEAFPERAEALYERYGLAPKAVRRQVADAWSRRFADDPALHASYQKLVQQYAAALKAGR